MDQPPQVDRPSQIDLRTDPVLALLNATRQDVSDNHRLLVTVEGRTLRTLHDVAVIRADLTQVRENGDATRKEVTELTRISQEHSEQFVSVRQDIADLRQDVDGLKEGQKVHQVSLDRLQGDMTVMKSDVGTLKSDVGTLKSDVSTLKSDVSTLKSDVSTLKSDVSGLNTSVTSLQDSMHILSASQKSLVAGQETMVELMRQLIAQR